MQTCNAWNCIPDELVLNKKGPDTEQVSVGEIHMEQHNSAGINRTFGH